MAFTLVATSQKATTSSLGDASAASYVVTPSPTAGNLLVATITYETDYTGTAPSTEPTRLVSGGGTWVERTHAFHNFAGTLIGISIWDCLSATGGLSTITATLTTTSGISVNFFTTVNVNEFSGGTVWFNAGFSSTVVTSSVQQLFPGAITVGNDTLIISSGYFNAINNNSHIETSPGYAPLVAWDGVSPNSVPGVGNTGGTEWMVFFGDPTAVDLDIDVTSPAYNSIGPIGAVAYTATVGSSVTVFPAGVTFASAENSPSISAGATVSPSGVTSASAENSPSPSAGVTVSPSGVTFASAEYSPTISAGAAPSPSGESVATAVNSPTISAGAVPTPSGVTAATAVGTPVATGGTSTLLPPRGLPYGGGW